MKTKQILLMALVSLFTVVAFSSCSKDEKEGSSSDLIGTWEAIRMESGGKVLEIEDGNREYFIFKADGGFELLTDYDKENHEIGKWAYNAPNIILTWDGGEGDVDYLLVEKLTSTELVIVGEGAKVTFRKQK
jgi:hypothetical protein